MRRIASLSILVFVLSSAAMAAERPALADAAEQGNKALVRTLLDARADVNAAQVDGTTALHWAVYRDDVETAGLLVRSGAKVNAAESLRRAAAVPGLHERELGSRRPSAERRRRRERVPSRR